VEGVRVLIKKYLELVKFEHTIFALPFAYLGAILADKNVPSFRFWFWITLAMVGARTAGMSLNRFIDRFQDAKNPRTANRALPKGIIRVSHVWFLAIGSILLLLLSSYKLNLLCLMLSPVAIGLLFLYSYMKRWTAFTHLGLGLVLACAPVGGWIAVKGHFNLAPLILAGAVLFWVAGFDIIYACQDIDYDRKEGLRSIPAALGIGRALWVSRAFHLLTFSLLLIPGFLLGLGKFYWFGLFLVAGLLIYEHSIVSGKDLSRVNESFFVVNGCISMILFLTSLLEVIYCVEF
jgi:4-hydroxybenzoate polyprenyltransferase